MAERYVPTAEWTPGRKATHEAKAVGTSVPIVVKPAVVERVNGFWSLAGTWVPLSAPEKPAPMVPDFSQFGY